MAFSSGSAAAEERPANLFGAGYFIAVAQSFPSSHPRPPALGSECTPIRVAGVRSMDQALETWRNLYDIDQEAYNQLRVLLSLFRQPLDGSHANLLPTGSNLNEPSIFSPGLLETGMPSGGSPDAGLAPALLESSVHNGGFSNAGLGPRLETGMPNGSFSNAGLTPDLLESKMPNGGFLNEYLSELDYLDLTSYEILNGSPGDANFLTSSSELDNATAETLERITLATQSTEESSPRLTPCIRCWRMKKKVRLDMAWNVFF